MFGFRNLLGQLRYRRDYEEHVPQHHPGKHDRTLAITEEPDLRPVLHAKEETPVLAEARDSASRFNDRIFDPSEHETSSSLVRKIYSNFLSHIYEEDMPMKYANQHLKKLEEIAKHSPTLLEDSEVLEELKAAHEKLADLKERLGIGVEGIKQNLFREMSADVIGPRIIKALQETLNSFFLRAENNDVSLDDQVPAAAAAKASRNILEDWKGFVNGLYFSQFINTVNDLEARTAALLKK